MVSDRRYRPKGMKKGEVQVHDNQNQKVYLSDDGVVIESPKKLTLKVGSSTVTIDSGSITFAAAAIKFEQA